MMRSDPRKRKAVSGGPRGGFAIFVAFLLLLALAGCPDPPSEEEPGAVETLVEDEGDGPRDAPIPKVGDLASVTIRLRRAEGTGEGTAKTPKDPWRFHVEGDPVGVKARNLWLLLKGIKGGAAWRRAFIELDKDASASHVSVAVQCLRALGVPYVAFVAPAEEHDRLLKLRDGLKELGDGVRVLTPDDVRHAQDVRGEMQPPRKRAGEAATMLATRMGMPPPPEPEVVIEDTLAGGLTTDVTKVMDGLVTVEIQKELSDHVKASLQDELAAAAKHIAEGKLSGEEIKALRRQFRQKAHDLALQALKERRAKGPPERRTLALLEWYEKVVSPTLFGNMGYHLYWPVNKSAPSHQMWRRCYTGTYGWGRWPNWSDLRSHSLLAGKLGQLGQLSTGQWRNAGGAGVHQHPAWGGKPNATQAKIILSRLKSLYNGKYSKTYPRPAWRDTVYGSKRTPRITLGILEEFHPHRMEAAQAVAEKLDRLWEKTLEVAEEYAAANGDDEAAQKKAQAACLDGIRQIAKTGRALLVKNPKERRAVNWAIRLDILTGPERDKRYTWWADQLVDGLYPMIRDFARRQFKKGIIVHKSGVDEAMAKFPATVRPLLQADVKKMLTHRKFCDRVHDVVYGFRGYHSTVTGKGRLPNRSDAKKEMAAARKTVARWPEADRAYADRRRELLTRDFQAAVASVKEGMLDLVFTGNLLYRKMGDFVEGVDYADKVQEKLDARAMALRGRGQDLADLTADGVPDTSAPLVTLMIGASKGHGANLEPVQTRMYPGYAALGSGLDAAVRPMPPAWPRAPAKWGFERQAEVQPKFQTARFDGIPFLAKFPKLDGKLTDWGRVRPLALDGPKGNKILVYAAWNYQGFFFGYQVKQHSDEFYWPSIFGVRYSLHSYVLGAGMSKNTGLGWAYQGDYLQLLFDTLDARSRTRGDPHTQEFLVFPQGTENSPELPGIERVIRSKRDAAAKQYRRVKASCRVFPQQSPREHGPDGRGPFRVTRATKEGYTVEVFLPRSLFKQPVFCPGWYVGFQCAVATGHQGRGRRAFRGQTWAEAGRTSADRPDSWGDLLLLGTDPRVIVQNVDGTGTLARGLVPGHSYLITIIDPDRNIRPTRVDTVLISAEVADPGESGSAAGDVEVYILNETRKNSGMFRGYINTQPGRGRQVQGVLELMPLQHVRLGYVDVADAKGRRKVIQHVRLPVVTGATHLVRAGP